MSDEVRILVAYYSRTGNTERLARAVGEGAAAVEGARVIVRPVDAVTREDLATAHAVVLGSPTHLGAAAGPMKTFLDDWELRLELPTVPERALEGKIGSAFATEGYTGGGQLVLLELHQSLLRVGMIVLAEPTGLGPVGRTEQGDTMPAACTAGRALGHRVATLARRLFD